VTVTLVVSFVVIGVAAGAQAVTGFGFALLAVPMLALVMPVEAAVVAGSLASLAVTTGTAIRERSHVRWRTAWFVIAVALLGMPLGLFLLKTLPAAALTALVGAAVGVSTWLVWRRPSIGGGPAALATVGALVGVLTTATGTNGPPLVAAFQSLGYDKHAFRATIAAIFTGCGVVSVFFFGYGGEITPTVARVVLVGLPGAALGWLVGDRLFRRLDPEPFRRLILVALVVASVVTLIRAIFGAG